MATNPGKPFAPTPRAEWCKVGDMVVATDGPDAMRGMVRRIVSRGHGKHTVVVEWASGATGRHTITTLRVAP